MTEGDLVGLLGCPRDDRGESETVEDSGSWVQRGVQASRGGDPPSRTGTLKDFEGPLRLVVGSGSRGLSPLVSRTYQYKTVHLGCKRFIFNSGRDP